MNQRFAGERVKCFAIIGRASRSAGPQLTPRMRVKRSVIDTELRNVFDSLYG